MNKIYHPLLALIASVTDSELAKYVEYLKHENKILRARLPKQVHTTYEERQIRLKYGKVIGRAIEEHDGNSIYTIGLSRILYSISIFI